jgi:N-acetylglucosamine-6-phosphate deacetylase
MNEGVRFLVEHASVSIEHAIIAATLNPAKAIRIEERKGQIRYGNDADLTVIDNDFSVVATYCMGKQVFKI